MEEHRTFQDISVLASPTLGSSNFIYFRLCLPNKIIHNMSLAVVSIKRRPILHWLAEVMNIYEHIFNHFEFIHLTDVIIWVDVYILNEWICFSNLDQLINRRTPSPNIRRTTNHQLVN